MHAPLPCIPPCHAIHPPPCTPPPCTPGHTCPPGMHTAPWATHAPLATHTCPAMHAPQGHSQQTCPPAMHAPPPVNRMTNRCKNITLPQTSFAGGKNDKLKMNQIKFQTKENQSISEKPINLFGYF